MAVICPNCGAENSEGTIYCGSCATQLVEFESNVRMSQGGAVALEPEITAEKHENELRKRFRKYGLRMVLAEGLLALLFFFPAILAGLRHDPLWYLSLLAPVFVVSVGVYYIHLSLRPGAMAFYRLGEYEGEVLAEVRGIRTVSFASLAAAMAAIAAILLYTLSSSGFNPQNPVILGCILAAIFIGLVVTKSQAYVTIEKGGVVYGAERAPLKTFMPMDKISSMQVRGNQLIIKLDEKAVSPIRRRSFLLIGDISKIDTVVQRLAPGGEVLPASLSLPRSQSRSVLAGGTISGERQEPIEKPLQFPTLFRVRSTGREVTPVAIGFALAMSGIFSFATGALLIMIPGYVPDFIQCCGMLEFIFAVIIFLGALMAFRRRHRGLVSGAAWLSILSLGGLFIGPLLGILSLWLLRKSADDFED
jgi:hypothetical protein